MSAPSAAVRRLLDALERGGHAPRANGAGWSARCPGHEDRVASLSIGTGREGAVLKCHAGCETTNVLKALGLELRDLFETRASSVGETRHEIRDTNGVAGPNTEEGLRTVVDAGRSMTEGEINLLLARKGWDPARDIAPFEGQVEPPP